MQEPELILGRDASELAVTAARMISQYAARSISERGRFTWALAGGSTPEKTYGLLAKNRGDVSVDWSKTYLFFGDERFVPADDPRSNYKMVSDALLATAPIAADHVFAIRTDLPTAKQCADEYCQTLSDCFATPIGHMPVFDLILLGLGDDGHTASLFPGAAALSVMDRAVTDSPPGVLPPPVNRITLTYPVLNAARQVLFLVAGGNKAEAFRDVWEGRARSEQRPAAGVHPENGKLTWLVDDAAALLLQPTPFRGK
jgi:6-phosphogluconolactonase